MRGERYRYRTDLFTSVHEVTFHPRVLTAQIKKKGELFSRTIHLETQNKTRQNNKYHSHELLCSRIAVQSTPG
nr:MAG TPA: hypothetical protein [Caudoviricetes sp.]